MASQKRAGRAGAKSKRPALAARVGPPRRSPGPAEPLSSPGPRRDGPIVDLPCDPARFYAVGEGFDSLAPPAQVDSTPALKRLGPLPLPKGRFPLLGFFATVYEQVARHVRESLGDDTPPSQGT